MRKLFLILILAFILSPLSVRATEPIRILLVPGHDNEVWGAQYGYIKEASMNRVLAGQIYDILKKDKRFKVWITRDKLGYTTEFADYFSVQRAEIISFKENAKKEIQNKISSGSFVEKINTVHNNASPEMAIKLYGFNKWANENKMDAVIHIHFNDYPRPDSWTKGKHKGFAVYVPEEQMANSKESTKLSINIFKELKKKYITSTYEKEIGGLVPGQTLIALGANGTLLESVNSVLIEYGYIYRFGNSVFRHKAYKDMASLTAKGIKSYFFK